MDVIVGLYKGSNSESKAINDGLKVFTVSAVSYTHLTLPTSDLV